MDNRQTIQNDTTALVVRDPISEAVENVFLEIGGPVAEQKRTPLRAGNVILVLTAVGSGIPYFVIAGTQVDTASPAVNKLASICIGPLVLVQASYAADEAWDFFQADEGSKQSVQRKVFNHFFSILGSFWQTFPFTLGSFVIGKSEVERNFLAAAVTYSGLVFYYLPTRTFLDRALMPLIWRFNSRLSSSAEMRALYPLRLKFLAVLNSACASLKNNMNQVGSVYEEIANIEDSSEKLFKLLQEGESWNNNQAIASSGLSLGGQAIQYALAAALGCFAANAETSYLCVTQDSFESRLDDASWPLSALVVAPTYFFIGWLGFKVVNSFFDNLRALVYGKPSDLPFSIRAYPKTATALLLFMLFLAAFGWADFTVTFNASCPDVLKSIIDDSIYFSAFSYDALIATQFVDKIIQKYVSTRSSGDAKMALDLIQALEKVIKAVDSSSNEKFSRFINSPTGVAIQQRFFKPAALEINKPNELSKTDELSYNFH